MITIHEWIPKESVCLCSPPSDDQITAKARALRRMGDQMFKDGQTLMHDGEELCAQARELHGEADLTLKKLWLSQDERGLMEILR